MFANPRTGATVHIYVAPPDGLFVTSHLVETEHELTVIDAQFRPEHAAEVKAYADSLSNPSITSGPPVSGDASTPPSRC